MGLLHTAHVAAVLVTWGLFLTLSKGAVPPPQAPGTYNAMIYGVVVGRWGLKGRRHSSEGRITRFKKGLVNYVGGVAEAAIWQDSMENL